MKSLVVKSCAHIKLKGAVVNPMRVNGRMGLTRGIAMAKLGRGCTSTRGLVSRRKMDATPIAVRSSI